LWLSLARPARVPAIQSEIRCRRRATIPTPIPRLLCPKKSDFLHRAPARQRTRLRTPNLARIRERWKLHMYVRSPAQPQKRGPRLFSRLSVPPTRRLATTRSRTMSHDGRACVCWRRLALHFTSGRSRDDWEWRRCNMCSSLRCDGESFLRLASRTYGVAYSGVRWVKLIEFYGIAFAAPWFWEPRGFDEPPFTFASFLTNPALYRWRTRFSRMPSQWRTIRELLTRALEVLTSSGYFACKRHAVLGADQAAELGSLPI
jgi:hypothetical protein